MARKEISSKDIEDWYHPTEARRRALRATGLDEFHAGEAVKKRVLAGQIKAAATTSSRMPYGKAIEPQDTPTLMGTGDWQAYREGSSNFWGADITLRFYEDHWDHDKRLTVEVFGLRLCRADVDRHFPSPVSTDVPLEADALSPQPRPQPTETSDDDPDDERLDVSAADLRIWSEAYKRIYGAGTLVHAVQSAKGMFPDKKVGRKRVRDLMAESGPRTPGRKAKA